MLCLLVVYAMKRRSGGEITDAIKSKTLESRDQFDDDLQGIVKQSKIEMDSIV